MNCQSVEKLLSAYRDGYLPESEKRELQSHLAGCRQCAQLEQQLDHLRTVLRGLPALTPPRDLSMSLRVMASYARIHPHWRTRIDRSLKLWSDRAQLWMDNLMRPLALPFLGGLVSAVVLFSMLTPRFASQQNPAIKDVPTALYTAATVKSMAPFGLSDEEILVEVTIDEQGRMADYSIPRGQATVLKDPQLRRSIETTLLFARFTPATSFGQPRYGKIRISFHRSRIDVTG